MTPKVKTMERNRFNMDIERLRNNLRSQSASDGEEPQTVIHPTISPDRSRFNMNAANVFPNQYPNLEPTIIRGENIVSTGTFSLNTSKLSPDRNRFNMDVANITPKVDESSESTNENTNENENGGLPKNLNKRISPNRNRFNMNVDHIFPKPTMIHSSNTLPTQLKFVDATLERDEIFIDRKSDDRLAL
eukprot:UN34622